MRLGVDAEIEGTLSRHATPIRTAQRRQISETTRGPTVSRVPSGVLHTDWPMATLSRCSSHPLGIARVNSSSCIPFGCRLSRIASTSRGEDVSGGRRSCR